VGYHNIQPDKLVAVRPIIFNEAVILSEAFFSGVESLP
jgi:hypothetical protein